MPGSREGLFWPPCRLYLCHVRNAVRPVGRASARVPDLLRSAPVRRPKGEERTTMDELARTHENRIEELEPGLHGLGTDPSFAIGDGGAGGAPRRADPAPRGRPR